MDKGDKYLVDVIDKLNADQIEEVNKAFNDCSSHVSVLSNKLAPLFETFVKQLDDTIKDAEEAKQMITSAFGVSYSKSLVNSKGTMVEHTKFYDLLEKRLASIKKEEEIEEEVRKRVAQMNLK